MQIKCPHCGTFTPMENINIQEMVALCSQCGQVFAFSRSAIARKSSLRKLKAPRRVRIHEDGERLELSYRLVLGAGRKFGVAASLVGVVFYSGMLATALEGRSSTPPLFIIGVLIALCCYAGAVFLAATTRIRVDSDEVRITSGPLPFPIKDDKTLNVHDVARVFSQRGAEGWRLFSPLTTFMPNFSTASTCPWSLHCPANMPVTWLIRWMATCTRQRSKTALRVQPGKMTPLKHCPAKKFSRRSTATPRKASPRK